MKDKKEAVEEKKKRVFFFFFFKQKTAYEIKECDWSSDVCSSDLWLQRYFSSTFFLSCSTVANSVFLGALPKPPEFSALRQRPIIDIIAALLRGAGQRFRAT